MQLKRYNRSILFYCDCCFQMICWLVCKRKKLKQLVCYPFNSLTRRMSRGKKGRWIPWCRLTSKQQVVCIMYVQIFYASHTPIKCFLFLMERKMDWVYLTYWKEYVTFLGCNSVLAVCIFLIPHCFFASSQPFAVSLKSERCSNLLKAILQNYWVVDWRLQPGTESGNRFLNMI